MSTKYHGNICPSSSRRQKPSPSRQKRQSVKSTVHPATIPFGTDGRLLDPTWRVKRVNAKHRFPHPPSYITAPVGSFCPVSAGGIVVVLPLRRHWARADRDNQRCHFAATPPSASSCSIRRLLLEGGGTSIPTAGIEDSVDFNVDL